MYDIFGMRKWNTETSLYKGDIIVDILEQTLQCDDDGNYDEKQVAYM